MTLKFLVIGFRDKSSEAIPVTVRPFLRSSGEGYIHYAENTEELQARLESLGDISAFEKVLIQEA